MYTASPAWLTLQLLWVVYCTFSIIFIKFLNKARTDIVISAFLLSFGISYILYFISLFVIAIVFAPFASNEHTAGTVIDYNTPITLIIYSLASTLQLTLAFLFFRIRRFKNGFPFLIKGYAIIASLIIAGLMLLIVTIGRSAVETYDVSIIPLLFASTLIIGIGIFIWIKRGIKSAYLRWVKENNYELYKKEISEKDYEIQRLTELTNKLITANHSINHRLSALELSYIALLKNADSDSLNNVTLQEVADSLEDVQRVARDYQRAIGQIKPKPLPSTKIKMLDDIFALFAERCTSNNIDFNLFINGSIPYMVENIVEQSSLETMICDHIHNSITSVNLNNVLFRNVFVILGLCKNFYAIQIFDSGIPFESDILMRLGTERVTTGGSGVGFMKTFETMKEYSASLIISEKKTSINGHSKSVTIRFDGKCQYIIETYRPSEFLPNNRYVVKSNNSVFVTV